MTIGNGQRTAEQIRLDESSDGRTPWKRWGPYLSERQWGTVREDYSKDGDAWSYFSHDQARSRAYRWGEDGLAGISDDGQHLCLALAMWNGADPILKERLFGLTNTEGNHGEDVKEYYFYLDSTPTHSFMRYLYKYPQSAFPYDDLVDTNHDRGYDDFEYELMDTGVFDQDRYFDVEVEYAKVAPEDILVTIEVTNRGPDPAPIHVLPTLWFRNTWWRDDKALRPDLRYVNGPAGASTVRAEHPELGQFHLYAFGEPDLLFTENETNTERLFNVRNTQPYVKDGINDAVVDGRGDAVNPARVGTKAAAHYVFDVAPGDTERVQLRLTRTEPDGFGSDHGGPFGAAFDATTLARRNEADEFYANVIPAGLPDDARLVMRQALAGMLWSKQFYYYDVTRWLQEHGLATRRDAARSAVRNAQWFHMVNSDIISMPDKWEYPWYATWDLAFHAVTLSVVDIDFAKHQLDLLLGDRYLHPNGQLPAYEWNFSDVNPPVHAWAVFMVYATEKRTKGVGDLRFLREAFNKLALNFTWWVNRKDPDGNDVFGGGFLGLDNIGVFDRSAPLPTGGSLEQADGTAWMAFYSLCMLEIAIELARYDPSNEPMAAKYFEQFLWIAAAMDNPDDPSDSLWDDDDGFFYDVLTLPDGRSTPLKTRSIVGLLPLAACVVLRPEDVDNLPVFMDRVRWLNEHRPHLTARFPSLGSPGVGNRRLLSVLDEDKLRRLLTRMLDQSEFLSDHGVRSLSRIHADHPFVVDVKGHEYRVDYLPAESNSGMFGGNSNWRGPIWFPMNFLLLRGLLAHAAYYGDRFTVECPTGSGRQLTLSEVAHEISSRLVRIFMRDDTTGCRPVYGGTPKFQDDPNWRDLISFHEYFHGDNGAGLGASHQTGWTGLVARLILMFATEKDLERFLAGEDPAHTAKATAGER